MLQINAGGTVFATTVNTISHCKLLHDTVAARKSSEEIIFIDRDPTVFGKMLKLLRGYYCPEFQYDNDVLIELLHWKHEMIGATLPEWLKPKTLTVHTLDPQQSEAFGATHALLPVSAIQKLVDMKIVNGPTERYVICKAVGATQGWIDSAWIENKEIELAILRYHFQMHFENPRMFGLKK